MDRSKKPGSPDGLMDKVAAAVSFFRRDKAEDDTGEEVTRMGAVDPLDGVSWGEFEMLICEGFRLQGFEVLGTGDGLVDVLLGRGNDRFVAHSRTWRELKVGADIVRQLHAEMTRRAAAGGFVITSGSFTAEALDFANGHGLRLIDGPRLAKLIQQTRASMGKRGSAG